MSISKMDNKRFHNGGTLAIKRGRIYKQIFPLNESIHTFDCSNL